MFEDIIRLKDQVDSFLKEARTVLADVKKACEELTASHTALKEKLHEVHEAHHNVLGWIADIDEEHGEEIHEAAAEAAQTAAAAASTAVAAASTVEAAAETVAAAVEEHVAEEVSEVTETKVETAEEKAAREKAEADKAAADEAARKAGEGGAPKETPIPAAEVKVEAETKPEATKRRHFI